LVSKHEWDSILNEYFERRNWGSFLKEYHGRRDEWGSILNEYFERRPFLWFRKLGALTAPERLLEDYLEDQHNSLDHLNYCRHFTEDRRPTPKGLPRLNKDVISMMTRLAIDGYPVH